MNPEFLDRSVDHNRSILVRRYYNKDLVNIWHYHEQVEIVGILKNTGTRFVGDNIEKYESGDIVIIGKNLPHMWQNDPVSDCNSGSSTKLEVVTIHLGNIFLNSNILTLPEYGNIQKLLTSSAQGIVVHNAHDILTKFKHLHEFDDFQQFSAVTEIMNDLGSCKQFEILTSKGFVEKLNDQKEGRLQNVHDYVMNNFREQIDLIKASEVASMNPSAFSRYFKQVYGKTFSKYVNEVRIGYACKLLLKGQASVAEVCFGAGFNNVSNFNKQFKKLHNISPKDYRNKFRN